MKPMMMSIPHHLLCSALLSKLAEVKLIQINKITLFMPDGSQGSPTLMLQEEKERWCIYEIEG